MNDIYCQILIDTNNSSNLDNIKAQNTALKNIKVKTFFQGLPIVETSKEPTTGEKITGVRKETPKIP